MKGVGRVFEWKGSVCRGKEAGRSAQEGKSCICALKSDGSECEAERSLIGTALLA